MPTTDSPLRYPGGKTQLAPLAIDVLRENDLFYGEYAEPFAGGAGLALKLLLDGYVTKLYLNDIDPAIHAMWSCVLNRTDEICDLIQVVEVSMDQWCLQKAIYQNPRSDILERGFAALFLNRTNRSGIIGGGVIGGWDQEGSYKLDCRFNKLDLVEKIRRIAATRDRIVLTKLDAVEFIKCVLPTMSRRGLVNLDPPYFGKGPELYTNFYREDDHRVLADAIGNIKQPWMVTYDDEAEIRRLYRKYPIYCSKLNYSAQAKRIGTELLILDPRLAAPKTLVGCRMSV